LINVQITNDGHSCETNCLKRILGYEIKATVGNTLLIDQCCGFVNFVADYITTGVRINRGEMLKYGYWLTKIDYDDQNRMIFLEYNPEGTEYIFGLDNTLLYWKEQHEICAKVNADFLPPRPDQLIVISDGVFEGDFVEGVRYPSPDHMSGWWFTTDKYDGNIKTLKTVHAHHISAKRPDLVKFFSLPFGYRFFSCESEVWFDAKVAPQ